jgi:hypothetical protein
MVEDLIPDQQSEDREGRHQEKREETRAESEKQAGEESESLQRKSKKGPG